MTSIKFEYDMAKAVEVILYIANRIPSPTFMSIFKLMYFADKTSLELFGRLICGDSYVAMENGPVPSASYNLVKAADDTDNYGFKVRFKYHIEPLREANLDELSESDIDCLDMTIDSLGKFPAWYLSKISHEDDAWQENWRKAGDRGSVPIAVEDIIDTLENADELLDYLEHRHDD